LRRHTFSSPSFPPPFPNTSFLFIKRNKGERRKNKRRTRTKLHNNPRTSRMNSTIAIFFLFCTELCIHTNPFLVFFCFYACLRFFFLQKTTAHDTCLFFFGCANKLSSRTFSSMIGFFFVFALRNGKLIFFHRALQQYNCNCGTRHPSQAYRLHLRRETNTIKRENQKKKRFLLQFLFSLFPALLLFLLFFSLRKCRR